MSVNIIKAFMAYFVPLKRNKKNFPPLVQRLNDDFLQSLLSPQTEASLSVLHLFYTHVIVIIITIDNSLMGSFSILSTLLQVIYTPAKSYREFSLFYIGGEASCADAEC
jgi:hypothetical protein